MVRGRKLFGEGPAHPYFGLCFAPAFTEICQLDFHRTTGSPKPQKSYDLPGKRTAGNWCEIFAQGVRNILGALAVHKCIPPSVQVNLACDDVHLQNQFRGRIRRAQIRDAAP